MSSGRRRAAVVLIVVAALAGTGAIWWPAPARRVLDTGLIAGGPYVQQVTSSSVIVAVLTSVPARLVLRLGVASELATAPLDRTIREEGALAEVHGLRAEGLSVATTYRYVVEDEAGRPLAEATLRTAPGPDATRVRFLVLGDSGGTELSRGDVLDALDEQVDRARGAGDDWNQQAKVAAAMRGHAADLVIHTGDVVYPDGELADYQAGFFLPFADLIARTPVYPTIGNHDIMTADAAPYLQVFDLPRNGVAADERTYSFDWANVHFVCLDVMSTPCDEGSAQLAWLDGDLAATDRPWKVVFFHVPPFGAGEHGDDERLQRALVPLLERHHVDLCLTGHDHLYARFFPVGSVTYVTTGGGGRSLHRVREDPRLAYAESVFHFVEVTVDGPELQLRAIDATGAVFDAVLLRKGG